MSDSLPAEHQTKSALSDVCKILALVLVWLLLLGPPVEHLLFGWLYFPVRVLPKVTADRPMLLLGFVAIAVFMGVLHFTLEWFIRQSDPQRRWSFQSTERVTGLILLVFVAGVAMVGATHQAVWILMAKPGSSIDEAAAEQHFVPSLAEAASRARDTARSTQSKNSLKQFGLAVHNFHDTIRFLPPGGTMTQDGRLLHGWPIFLGNYMGYSSSGVDFSIPWNESPNDRLFRCGLAEFINPSVSGPTFDQDGFGLCHYAGNRHVLTPQTIRSLPGNRGDYWEPPLKASGRTMKLKEIADGTSNTILIGTAAGNYHPWGHPANLREPGDGINKSPNGFGGPWKAAQILFCDGSVKMVSEKVDSEVLKALGTPADGRHLDVDF